MSNAMVIDHSVNRLLFTIKNSQYFDLQYLSANENKTQTLEFGLPVLQIPTDKENCEVLEDICYKMQ